MIRMTPAIVSNTEFFRAALWLLLKWQMIKPRASVIRLTSIVKIKIIRPHRVKWYKCGSW